MLLINAINQNLYEQDHQSLLSKFSETRDLYEKYGNFIICFNFVMLSYSVISFILLARVFETLQEFCPKSHLKTYCLSFLTIIIYITSSLLVGIAVKRRSPKYFRKFLVLIIGCLLTKLAQFFLYKTQVQEILGENPLKCAEIDFIEEKDPAFLMETLCYGLFIYLTMKLRGCLILLVDIRKKLVEMGHQPDLPNIYESFED